MIEQDKSTYSPLGKDFEKQTNKQVGASKSLSLSNTINELNRFKRIFLQDQLKDFIREKLKEVKKLQNDIN